MSACSPSMLKIRGDDNSTHDHDDWTQHRGLDQVPDFLLFLCYIWIMRLLLLLGRPINCCLGRTQTYKHIVIYSKAKNLFGEDFVNTSIQKPKNANSHTGLVKSDCLLRPYLTYNSFASHSSSIKQAANGFALQTKSYTE